MKRKQKKPVKKRKRQSSPVSVRIQSVQERKALYQKTALVSNLLQAVFSVFFMIGLFLPYIYLDGIVVDGEIYGGGPVSAMGIFKLPMIYLGLMALLCVLSILSIILEKSYSKFVAICILLCFPEFAYHLYTDINLIFLKGGLPFGAGYWIMVTAFIGIMISATVHEINERYYRI